MECTTESCTTESCKTEAGATCACGSNKSYEDCCGCESPDPIQHAMMAWHNAFFAAHHEAMKDRMRKRIEAAYGPTMDKAGDAVIETVGKVWSAMLTQSEAKKDLVSKLQKIFSESKKG